ncbi:MAG: molybdenum cofactor guanylyltransferase [Candidatus Methanomethylicaceae archaeon]
MREPAVAIAAGGSSSRLGTPKPFLRLGDSTLLEYAVEYAFGISDEVYLLARDPARFPPSIFSDGRSPRLILDDDHGGFPDRIVGSLRKTQDDLIFLMGCDTPFLDPRLPFLLLSKIGDHGAAVPAWQNGYLEPLAALYRASALPSRRGIPSMRQLCLNMEPVFVKMEDAGIPSWTFLNINTKEDLLEAELILRSSRSPRSSCGKSSIPRCPKSRCSL